MNVNNRTTPIALRAAADASLALFSLAAGLAARLLLKGSAHLRPELLQFFESYALLLTVSVLATFAMFHIYTRNRIYVRRQKLMAIVKATLLAYAIFLGAVYLFQPAGNYIPRGALLTSFAITLGGACGGRLLMEYLHKIFIFESAR